ncbi:HlyC/CorC family transporter [Paraferrimonas sedimenticola]|uniref:Membrane protein n=1 Tax=Paraferrimonas sedimenticola TaxID=375674 RepID=A0AA37VYV7_9GAMM|nr:CNNM domain-containing protein [Paraferrimonas sedimenticola]GLP97181.1 membrane protein [Paraferrimonas sedimenticola]
MDDISTGTLLLILAGLILVSAYFSGSETAMMSLNRYRLRHLRKEGHRGARRAGELLEKPDRLIGLILIGNNLVNILASAIATVIGMRLYGDVGIAIATGVLTLVVLVFAEVTPKTVSALYPERVAYPSSALLKVLLKVLSPLVITVNFITNGFLALLGIKTKPEEDDLSQEELRTVVHETGTMIPSRHRDMLLSILDLEKVTVEDVMIPRAEIFAINVNDDIKVINKALTHSPRTRVVLYRDTIDDVVGFLHMREVMRLLTKQQFTKATLLRSSKEPYYIPEGTPLNVQLLKFQRNNERIGLVVDEYGDIQGLVTLEDILEEIVGDFTTSATPSVSEDIQPQQDGSVLIEGSVSLRELNKEMGWHLPTNGPKTLNGLIIEFLEDLPQEQVSLKIEQYPMEIVEVRENRIKTVRFINLNPE